MATSALCVLALLSSIKAFLTTVSVVLGTTQQRKRKLLFCRTEQRGTGSWIGSNRVIVSDCVGRVHTQTVHARADDNGKIHFQQQLSVCPLSHHPNQIEKDNISVDMFGQLLWLTSALGVPSHLARWGIFEIGIIHACGALPELLVETGRKRRSGRRSRQNKE